MNQSDCFQVSPVVSWQRIMNETVILDLRKRVIMGLNATGGQLWQGIVARKPRWQLVDELVERYRQDPAVIRADVDRLLRELLDRGIIILL